MWFKNLQVFSISGDLPYDPDTLAEELAAFPFVPCSKVTPLSAGFVPPIGTDEHAPLVHGANGYMLLCLKIQKKLLPPAVLNEQHASQVADLEQKQGRKLYRDEKQRLKEELYYTLLSQAFVSSSRIYAYIDTKRQELVVSSTVEKDLERLFTYLNKIFPSQAMSHYPLVSPPAVMTHWLKSAKYPAGFSLADSCMVCEGDERKGVVRFTRKDLRSEALQKLISEGCLVMQLGVSWREQLQCQLRKDLSIGSIKYHDSVREASKDTMTETEEDRQAADFFMMAETTSQFLNDLLPAFVDESDRAALSSAEKSAEAVTA